MSRLPERRATLWLGVLIIALAFALTLILVWRGQLNDEALGIVLGAWLTSGMVTVVNFWFGTSLGGRLKNGGDDPTDDGGDQ